MSLSEIANKIKESKNVLILPHLSADGDALGSSFGLYNALVHLGINPVVMTDEKIPSTFEYLSGSDKAIYENYHEVNEEFDVVVAIDSGDIERMGLRRSYFENAPFTINIDHHKTNTRYGNLNHVDVEAASTGEIIYSLICELGCDLNKKIAECIYNAMTCDTGGFRYSNTTARSHTIAAELLKVGVDVGEISRRIFEVSSFEKIKLISLAASNIELFVDGKIAILILTEEMFEKTGATQEDSEGLVNIVRNIKGVEVGVLIKDKPNGEVKISMRSNNLVDVSEIAAKFSGGGHKRAAGYSVKKPINEAKIEIIENLTKVVENVWKPY